VANRTINKAVGIYLYRFRIDPGGRIEVGRLGAYDFPPGWYVYAGSARGGLRSRLLRHLRGPAAGRFHWHVDYLAPFASQKSFAVVRDELDGECRLNDSVAAIAGARAPVAGFGSSDCRCTSHLHRLPAALWPDYPGLAAWQEEL